MFWSNPLALLKKEHTLRARHPDLLGTSVDIKIVCRQRRHARAADRTIVAQIERLESVVAADEPGSDLSRFRRGEHGRFGPEFERVIGAVAKWQTAGHTVDAAHIATGYIIDAAMDRAMQLRPAPQSVTLAAGPNAAHRGTGSSIVTVEASTIRVELANAALATHRSSSGESSSVVAPDSVTANALAAALATIGPAAATEHADFTALAWMTSDSTGAVHESGAWDALELD